MIDQIRDHVDEHRWGMLFDLVFAIAWVSVVTALFSLLQTPQWVYYLTLAGGVAAYYGFVTSLESARERQGQRASGEKPE